MGKSSVLCIECLRLKLPKRKDYLRRLRMSGHSLSIQENMAVINGDTHVLTTRQSISFLFPEAVGVEEQEHYVLYGMQEGWHQILPP